MKEVIRYCLHFTYHMYENAYTVYGLNILFCVEVTVLFSVHVLPTPGRLYAL